MVNGSGMSTYRQLTLKEYNTLGNLNSDKATLEEMIKESQEAIKALNTAKQREQEKLEQQQRPTAKRDQIPSPPPIPSN